MITKNSADCAMFDGAISIHSLSSSHDTIVPCSQDNNVSSLHNDNVSPSHCDNLPNSQCSPLCSCDICPRLPVSCCCMGLRKLHLLGCVTRCIFVCQGPWGPALAGWLQGQSDRSVVRSITWGKSPAWGLITSHSSTSMLAGCD